MRIDNEQLRIMVEISFNQLISLINFFTSNTIASFFTFNELNQVKIENGELTIVLEINSYKLISLNRFFNKSDCITLKRNKFKTSLIEREVSIILNCRSSILNCIRVSHE